jgi:transcriptional regulator with XRE-family HTH domain
MGIELKNFQHKGGGSVTDTERLKERIKKSGLKMNYIAEQIGITREGLYNKINGKNDFKATEIAKLQDLLGLSLAEKEKIFFARWVEKSSTR